MDTKLLAESLYLAPLLDKLMLNPRLQQSGNIDNKHARLVRSLYWLTQRNYQN